MHTLPGRVLLAGAVVRVLTWLVQRVAGDVAALEILGTMGTLALLGSAAYFAWRVVAAARRRFLWRVRRKLILSFVFIGLVPALLIIVFFALFGLSLFGTISSYAVQTRLERATDASRFVAASAAADLALERDRTERARLAGRAVRQLEAVFPGASLAVVPIERSCAFDESSGEAPSAGPVEPLAAGSWTHTRAPSTLPQWIGCRGFTGIMAHWGGETPLFARAVALPQGPAPRFAVIVDAPLGEAFIRRVREETGISLLTAAPTPGQRASLERPPAAGQTPAGSADGAEFESPIPVPLSYTDWTTGSVGEATLSISTNVRETYSRLSSAGNGGRNIGNALLFLIAFVGILFLLIQFVALLMGLGLARSITGSVHELFEGTERVRQGDFSHQIRVRARDQLGELADSFNGMTSRLGQLLVEMAEKKRLEEELRIARDIQMSLLPQNPPVTIPGITLTALCHPAREVGGDYYDFFPLGPGRLGLLIADVSGKGTSAAFYMAELKGLMLSLSQVHRSPRELLIAANQIIAANLDSRSFITITYAVLDLEARTMTWARAGHTPLLYLPGGDSPRRARILISDGLVLGLKIDNGERFAALLEEASIPLAAGDLFMFFTDGLSEQMNPGEELFGEARLGELIEQHHALPFDELRERIVREVRAFADGAAQHDDLTFILLRVDQISAPRTDERELAVVTA